MRDQCVLEVEFGLLILPLRRVFEGEEQEFGQENGIFG